MIDIEVERPDIQKNILQVVIPSLVKVWDKIEWQNAK